MLFSFWIKGYVFAYSKVHLYMHSHFIFIKVHYACTFYIIYLGDILARKGCEPALAT
jgi:hypothetical protein